jgi:hypothetical protein
LRLLLLLLMLRVLWVLRVKRRLLVLRVLMGLWLLLLLLLRDGGLRNLRGGHRSRLHCLLRLLLLLLARLRGCHVLGSMLRCVLRDMLATLRRVLRCMLGCVLRSMLGSMLRNVLGRVRGGMLRLVLRCMLRCVLGCMGRRMRTRSGAFPSSRLRGCGSWGLLLLLLGRWSRLRLLSVRLNRWGGVVLRVLLVLLLLLLVRVLWLRRLRWLCGVCSIIHRLVPPSHVGLRLLLRRRLLLLLLLLLLRSSISRLTVPSGMVSKRVWRRRRLGRLQWLLLGLQRGHRCRLQRTP